MALGRLLALWANLNRVRVDVLKEYLRNSILPVVAPISLGADGEAYNVNGDRAAMSIAGAMRADELIFNLGRQRRAGCRRPRDRDLHQAGY